MMAIRSAHAAPGQWEKIIERFKDHPAILAWATMDEPHERHLFKQGREMYAWINEHDPYHPIQMAQCYSDMYRATAAMCDILSPDHYPFNVDPWWKNMPWWKDRYQSPTRITTRLYGMVRAVLGANRPMWPVVQLNGGDRPVKLPEPKHIRLQIYQAIIAGARGMLFYAYVCPDTRQGDRRFWVENHPEIWNAVGKLNQELIDLEPVLLAPGGEVLKCKGQGNSAADIRAMVRPIGQEACLFVVNIDAHQQAGTLTLPAGYTSASRWFDKQAPARPLQGKLMKVELEPWGSQVWRLKSQSSSN